MMTWALGMKGDSLAALARWQGLLGTGKHPLDLAPHSRAAERLAAVLGQRMRKGTASLAWRMVLAGQQDEDEVEGT